MKNENDRGSILVIDDDRDIREFLKVYINSSGYDCYDGSSYDEALELIENNEFDLIILDIVMPRKDGLEACREIRRHTDVPIIFLSCKNEEMDIIKGLSVGADDYITKPFLPGELMARINSHIRRAKKYKEGSNSILAYGRLRADLLKRQVWVNEKAVNLLPKEYDILILMMKNPERVFSKSEIFIYIWHDQLMESDLNTITVHISNLRRKLNLDMIDLEIVTIKGIGYKLTEKRN